jgi:hypothetical protein
MNIRFVERRDLDDLKWNAAVEADSSGMPYAYTWYLDIVCEESWNGLVFNDYEAVFPLPFNKKLWISLQVYQPILTQQLGVYGQTGAELFADFLQHIPPEYKRVNLQTRQVLKIKGWRCKKRLNLLIKLDKPYTEIYQGYKKNLQKRLEKSEARLTISENGSPNQLVALYKNIQGERVGFSEENFQQAYSLIKFAVDHGFGKVLEVKDVKGKQLCLGFFLISAHRIINLYSAATEKGRRENARHFMIDYLLKKYAGSGKIFDFEGSEIPGVQKFFRSFGPEESFYASYERNKLPKFWKWAIKTRKKIKRKG